MRRQDAQLPRPATGKPNCSTGSSPFESSVFSLFFSSLGLKVLLSASMMIKFFVFSSKTCLRGVYFNGMMVWLNTESSLSALNILHIKKLTITEENFQRWQPYLLSMIQLKKEPRIQAFDRKVALICFFYCDCRRARDDWIEPKSHHHQKCEV